MMQTQTLTVPTVGNGEASICGEVVGPFIIHRPPGIVWTLRKTWHVTHVKSGMRFPWDFERKETARLFCRRVRKMTDWEQVDCRRSTDPSSTKADWATNLPTEEQRKEIKALAASLSSQQREAK